MSDSNQDSKSLLDIWFPKMPVEAAERILDNYLNNVRAMSDLRLGGRSSRRFKPEAHLLWVASKLFLKFTVSSDKDLTDYIASAAGQVDDTSSGSVLTDDDRSVIGIMSALSCASLLVDWVLSPGSNIKKIMEVSAFIRSMRESDLAAQQIAADLAATGAVGYAGGSEKSNSEPTDVGSRRDGATDTKPAGGGSVGSEAADSDESLQWLLGGVSRVKTPVN